MARLAATAAVLIAILGVAWWSFTDDFDPNSLRDKVVVITGASRGIGEQLAYQYARAGAALLLTARNNDTLLLVASRCLQLGSPRVKVVSGDMGDAGHRLEVMRKTREFFGRLDYLVLNHVTQNFGYWKGGEADLSNFDLLWRVNVVAYVDLASSALDLLERSSGSVVVLSSIAGRMGYPTIAAYTTSKFALEGFFSAFRQELIYRKSNVTVTVCVLGLIATDLTMNAFREFYSHGEDIETYLTQPNDTAMAIVKAAALKKSVMFYPKTVYFLNLGYALFPDLIERVVRMEMCDRFDPKPAD